MYVSKECMIGEGLPMTFSNQKSLKEMSIGLQQHAAFCVCNQISRLPRSGCPFLCQETLLPMQSREVHLAVFQEPTEVPAYNLPS